jgi:hypothetical protein
LNVFLTAFLIGGTGSAFPVASRRFGIGDRLAVPGKNDILESIIAGSSNIAIPEIGVVDL